MTYVSPRQVREHMRDDTPEASAETMDAVLLLREERLEFRSKVHDPAFRVLGGSWIKANRARPEIDLPALQRQDLGAHPPAVRVRERDSDPGDLPGGGGGRLHSDPPQRSRRAAAPPWGARTAGLSELSRAEPRAVTSDGGAPAHG